jgi:acyl carrier protein
MEFNQEQIRVHVIQALAKSLTRNPEEIKATDTLINDLGLDSLDFLDLMFALEKYFKVKIRDAAFDRLLKPTQNEALPPHLTEEEIQAMRPLIPGLEKRAEQGVIPRNSVISLMTVDSLVNMVTLKLEAQTK